MPRGLSLHPGRGYFAVLMVQVPLCREVNLAIEDLTRAEAFLERIPEELLARAAARCPMFIFDDLHTCDGYACTCCIQDY